MRISPRLLFFLLSNSTANCMLAKCHDKLFICSHDVIAVTNGTKFYPFRPLFPLSLSLLHDPILTTSTFIEQIDKNVFHWILNHWFASFSTPMCANIWRTWIVIFTSMNLLPFLLALCKLKHAICWVTFFCVGGKNQ